MKRKQKPTIDDFLNLWLEKYHNTNIEEVKKLHPEWMDGNHARDFYNTYAVTEQQHDEWYEEVIALIQKHWRISKKRAKRDFALPYLNCAPNVRKDEDS